MSKIVEVWHDILIHKQLVLASCAKMSRYFEAIGEHQKASEIYRRGIVHDNSKLGIEEIVCLAQIDDNFHSMRHARARLPDEMKEFLGLHYAHNTHHPEHWEDVSQMPEMDMAEMTCDWHARSTQFGTDLLQFAKTRQVDRFHFPPDMFDMILEFCKVLVS